MKLLCPSSVMDCQRKEAQVSELRDTGREIWDPVPGTRRQEGRMN